MANIHILPLIYMGVCLLLGSVYSVDEPDCKWFKLEDVGLHEDADGLYELKTDDVCNGKYYYKQIKPANGHYLYYLTNGGDRWVGGDYMCEEEIQVFLWGAGDVISPDLVPKNTWKEKLDAASKEFHLDRNITVLCIDEPGCKWVKLEDVALHRDADGFFELKTDQICNDKFYYKQRKPNLGHYLYYLPSRWVGGDFVCEEENEVFLWGAGDVISPDLVPKNTWKEKLDAASQNFLLDINITVSCTERPSGLAEDDDDDDDNDNDDGDDDDVDDDDDGLSGGEIAGIVIGCIVLLILLLLLIYCCCKKCRKGGGSSSSKSYNLNQFGEAHAVSAVGVQNPGFKADSVDYEKLKPRLCKVRMKPEFQGYGFNLVAEKGRAGHYVGTVDRGSPAEDCGLREGDHIIEVNDQPVGMDTHQQLIQKIKCYNTKVDLLVLDPQTDAYYKQKGILFTADDPRLRPRLCYIRRRADFQGFGFNLQAEKGRAGHYIGTVDPDSPAEVAGIKESDHVIEVNGDLIGQETHHQVVQRIKTSGDVVLLLVTDPETDNYYNKKGVRISSLLPGIQKINLNSTDNYEGLVIDSNSEHNYSDLRDTEPSNGIATAVYEEELQVNDDDAEYVNTIIPPPSVYENTAMIPDEPDEPEEPGLMDKIKDNLETAVEEVKERLGSDSDSGSFESSDHEQPIYENSADAEHEDRDTIVDRGKEAVTASYDFVTDKAQDVYDDVAHSSSSSDRDNEERYYKEVP